MAWPPIPLLVSGIVASLSQHLVGIDNHGIYLIGNPVTTQSHQNKHLMLSRHFIMQKWNSFHFLGKKLDYLYHMDFLKYECELY